MTAAALPKRPGMGQWRQNPRRLGIWDLLPHLGCWQFVTTTVQVAELIPKNKSVIQRAFTSHCTEMDPCGGGEPGLPSSAAPIKPHSATLGLHVTTIRGLTSSLPLFSHPSPMELERLTEFQIKQMLFSAHHFTVVSIDLSIHLYRDNLTVI